MKTTPLFLLVAAIVALPTSSALAKGKGKGKGPGPAPAAQNAESPSKALAPYINNLDALLALQRPPGKKAPAQHALIEKAPGQLVTLRQEFTEQRGKAPEAERAKYDAAIATCNALTGALDERQKVLGDLRASGANKGSGKLEQGPRKDNLQQGLHGDGLAKAVGADVELQREKAANKKAAQTAAANDDALSAMAVNRWNQRSIELRKQINASYARIQ